MIFVADASAIGSFLLPDEIDAFAGFALQCCSRGTVHVPAIWRGELCNMMVKAYRRGRIDEHVLRQITARALVLAGGFHVADDAAMPEILDAALSTGLSAYDASYAVLARRRGIPLLTRDAQLSRAAEMLGVEVLRP